jgi:hypothetical protein
MGYIAAPSILLEFYTISRKKSSSYVISQDAPNPPPPPNDSDRPLFTALALLGISHKAKPHDGWRDLSGQVMGLLLRFRTEPTVFYLGIFFSFCFLPLRDPPGAVVWG